MSWSLRLLVLLVVLPIALPWVLGPFIVWRKQWLPARYRFAPKNPEKFLQQNAQAFAEPHAAALRQGFEFALPSRLLVGGATSVFTLYYSMERQLACMIFQPQGAPAQFSRLVIEFIWLARDGSVIDVNNSLMIEGFPDREDKLVFRFPQFTEFDDLLRCTERLVPRHRGAREALRIRPQDVVAAAEQYLDRELVWLTHSGYLLRGTREDRRWLTLRGAATLTWRQCWPRKQMLDRAQRRASARALAEDTAAM